VNFNLKDYKKIRTPFVFFDETGSINDQANRFFGLGMIKCMQLYYLDYGIRQIRQKYQFYDEIKWNTLSKAKIKIIKLIINQVFSTPGIYFAAIIINKNDINFEKQFHNNPYQAYQEFSENLLISNIQANEVLTILADYITTPRSVRFEVDIKHNLNQALGRLAISGVHRVDSKGVTLIQIVDLLLGAVIYEYKLKYKLVKGDRHKLTILGYIRGQLNKKSLIDIKSLKRFRVIEYTNKKGPSS